jgi:Na+/melibiose symporter-like transporter
MIDLFLIIACSVAVVLLFFFWFAKQSIKSGISKDDNQNNIPDSWEKKLGLIFKLKNFLILILGIIIGLLLGNSSFLQ